MIYTCKIQNQALTEEINVNNNNAINHYAPLTFTMNWIQNNCNNKKYKWQKCNEKSFKNFITLL